MLNIGCATRSLRNLSKIKPIGGILNRELQLCYLWGRKATPTVLLSESETYPIGY